MAGLEPATSRIRTERPANWPTSRCARYFDLRLGRPALLPNVHSARQPGRIRTFDPLLPKQVGTTKLPYGLITDGNGVPSVLLSTVEFSRTQVGFGTPPPGVSLSDDVDCRGSHPLLSTARQVGLEPTITGLEAAAFAARLLALDSVVRQD